MSRPVLTALSPAYQQGTRLDDLIEPSLEAFERELAVDGDAVQALRRLSEEEAFTAKLRVSRRAFRWA